DDVGSEIPAVRLQGEGYAPRDAQQVLGFEPDCMRVTGRVVAVVSAPVHPLPIFGAPSLGSGQRFGWLVRASSPRCVAVAEVQPERAVTAEYPPHLTEHG